MEAQSHRPPASQASGRVFRDSAERSLRIFVEASDLLHRPKVINTLKNNGATIVHSPDEAAIIIVDPQTASGSQFIEEWGSEPGKVVLDVPWVQKSVARGRAFIADESWGGFCLSENASGTVQDPLPTPRDTPPDAPASQAEFSMQNQPPYPPPGGSQFNPPNVPLGYPFPQQLQQGQMGQQMPNGLPSGAPIPPAGIQDPNAQVVLPAHLVAQLVGFVSQQGLNPANLGMPHMVAQMGNQIPMNMMQGQPMPQGYPFMSQPGIFVQPQYPLSQQHGMFLPQQMMPPPMSPMSQMHPPDAGSPNHYHQSPTPATPDRRLSESLSRRQGSMSAIDTAGSPMQDVRPTSRKRKSPATDKASTSRRAGKGRADGERSHKQRRVSHPPDEAPLLYPDATPHSPQPQREPSSSLGKLFAQEDGEPYKFYVQIDIRPRTKIADAIKKNGGKLVPDIADADYVILGSHSTRTFEERLKQAGNYGKLAVRPQWVFQCVEQNEIVELDEFVFEGIQVEKKRGRPSASGKRFILTGPNAPSTSKGNTKASQQPQGSDEEDVLEDEDADESDETDDTLMKKATLAAKQKAVLKEPTKKKAKVEKKADKSSAKTKASAGEGTSKGSKPKAKSTERSPFTQQYWRPSPPPPTRVVEHMPGKNMYTKEDQDYVDEYLPILFFRDPDITFFAISEKLHAKMPHHTQKSWQTHITYAGRRDRVEKMRRQAHIARRKAAASGVQRVSEPVDSNTSEPTQTVPAPAQPSLPPPSIDMFEALANFFAGGGADNLADTEVWNEVHRKHPELSAEAWEAYWMKHNHEIAAAVRRISGVTDSEGAASEAPMQYGNGYIVPKPEPE